MISKKLMISDGTNKRYLSDFIIRSEQFCRVYVYKYDDSLNPDGSEDHLEDIGSPWSYPDNLYVRGTDNPKSSEDLITIDKFDLVDNSIVFYSTPTTTTKVWIEVATTAEEFGDTLTASSAAKAEEAANAAANSANNAKTSETNAKTSETNAANSEFLASGEASAASNSASQAQGYATDADASKGQASFYATTATNAATSASTSEDNAKVSETNAKTSEDNAKVSEDASEYWATLATIKAGAGSIGNINNPLLDLPLNSSLAMKQGVGSVTTARNTTTTVIDRYGAVKDLGVNEIGFNENGILIEGASTNLFLNSDIGATQSIAITSGQTYTVSFFEGVGTITLSDGGAGIVDKDTNITFVATSTNLVCTVTSQADKVNVEKLPYASSYIPTTTTAVTRTASLTTAIAYDNIPNLNEDWSFAFDLTVNGKNTDAVVGQFLACQNSAGGDLITAFRYSSDDSGLLRFFINSGGTKSVEIGNYAIGSKIRVTITKEANSIISYVDGVLTATLTLTAGVEALPSLLKLNGWGNSTSTVATPFISLKNVRYWDRTLTAQEVGIA